MNNLALSEATPVGWVVYTLEGYDPEDGEVTFGLIGSENFAVNPKTGEVKLIKALDRENLQVNFGISSTYKYSFYGFITNTYNTLKTDFGLSNLIASDLNLLYIIISLCVCVFVLYTTPDNVEQILIAYFNLVYNEFIYT